LENTELGMLAEINNKVGKLEGAQEASVRAIGEMATNVNRLIEKLDQSNDIAREADQRARSAHHRIDEMGKRMDKTEDRVSEEAEKAKAGRRWLVGTILSGVGLFISVLSLIIKMR
jgi:methyl-accepting chemotaxis protein